jgi:hypothetical protein
MIKNNATTSAGLYWAGKKYLLKSGESLSQDVTGWDKNIELAIQTKLGRFGKYIEIIDEDVKSVEEEVVKEEEAIVEDVKTDTAKTTYPIGGKKS